jgi:putative nucleotidyltransferase with HDIG domain
MSKVASTATSERVERAKKELERLIDLCPQVMLLVHRDGTVIRANVATLVLTGVADIRALPGSRLDKLIPGDDAEFISRFLATVDTDRSVALDVSFPDGRRRSLHITAVAAGHEADTVAIQIEDVTDQPRHPEAIRKQAQKETVRSVVGGLMHHLNQPLTVMTLRGYLMEADLSKEKPDYDAVRGHLREIMNLTFHVAHLLQRAGEPVQVATEAYPGGDRILDMAKATGSSAAALATMVPALGAMIDMMDSRMPGYARHAVRTATVAARLATELGMDGLGIESVRRTALIHDIGKLSVPDSLLSKATLTEEELATIHTHTEAGAQLVSSMGFLSAEAAAVRAHHERYDGKGRPNGLAARAIPRAARIVAVADAFERHCFSGPPAERVSPEAAFKRIEAEAARQFDPEVVGALRVCWQELAGALARE